MYVMPKEWNPNTKYIVLDLIEYDGELYVAKHDFVSGNKFNEVDVDLLTGFWADVYKAYRKA